MTSSTLEAYAVAGSFRDPSGRVFKKNGRVFRTINSIAASDFDFVRRAEFYEQAINQGWLIEANIVDKDALGEEGAAACYVLEHPQLPFISYPYEWPFPALKDPSPEPALHE